MQAYSKEFRRDVLAACDAGGGTKEVSLQFEVSESWVRRIKQQRRETGQIAPKTTRKRRPSWETWADWLRAEVAATPDAYLRELKVRLKQARGIDVRESLIGAACYALELTRKKRRSLPLSRIGKTLPRDATGGVESSRPSIPTVGSSSTKRGPRRI
jgi:transposase